MSAMSTKRDYYEVLGVSRNATQEEIRRAFRTLARKHHPDVNQGNRDSEELFKDIKEAHDVLSDPEKRQHYDQFGHVEPGQGGFDVGNFGVDIFDLFFGGRQGSSRRNAPQEGSDLRYDMEITLEEAAAGVERTFTITRERSCSSCNGSRTRAGAKPAPCSACGGAGQVRRSQQTMLGSFSTVVACPRCQGEGTIVTDPCQECKGSGRERVDHEIHVRVPPGVSTGNRIQMAGEGDGGLRGGPSGDLYIFIRVAPHERFERHGNDLATEVPISFSQAALGTTVQAPTLKGATDLHVPAGTQPGHVFRIRGEGMPELNGRSRGDLHVLIRIPVPEKLNERQRHAIEELAASFEEQAKGPSESGRSEGLRGFFEKAKELF